MAKKQSDPELSCRLNKVGGQAVIEGVMMKAGDHTVTTCRKPDGSLVVTDDSFVSIRKKHKFLNIPILRGVVNFIEMMKLSFKTLGASADALGLEEEEPSRFEKWLARKFGVGITDFIMVISLILGLGLSVLLFMLLPIWISIGINWILGLFGMSLGVFTAVLEGFVKVGIFLGYLSLVALMPDIKRTFMYHGAEHKSIACFESGEALTPENAKKHTRFHPRCGTSFMFFMILLGIIAGLFIKMILPGLSGLAYTGIRLLILPILMGLGYEIIMIAGKHPNPVTRAISTPGLWVQRITTKEPTEDMLEVAITSIKCALREDFPEFNKFFLEKGWEKTEAVETTAASQASDNTEADEKKPADTLPENEDFLDKIKRILDGGSTEAEREAAFAKKTTVSGTPKSEEPTEAAENLPNDENPAEDGSEA